MIYAFDESPARQGVFYAGTNDGKVHVSRDNGANWVDVTANLPGAPKDGVVRGIDASKWNAGKAYLVIEGHEVGDFRTYAYRTSDFGRTWKLIVEGVPAHPNSFTRSIQEDPVRQGLLYLGTENRIYVSFDDGDRWQPLINNMPPSPIYDLKVQEHFNDLVVGTYGRGYWIMDDLTPLQQLTPQVAASAAHLFRPRDAYRFQQRTQPMTMPNDMTAGQNPEYGASINYWLGSTPRGPVTIRIADASGVTVRTMQGPRERGINRVWWNLQDTPSLSIRLRTTPLYADWVDLGPNRVRSGGNGISILQPPGSYTVTLEVDGRTFSQPLRVLKDPNSDGTEADIIAQMVALRAMRADHDSAASAINRIEWTRRQVLDLEAILRDQGGAGTAEILQQSGALSRKLIEVEEHLIQLRLTGTGQDGVRWPAQVRAGGTTAQHAVTMDWVATFLDAAGVPAHPDYPLDGASLLGVLDRPEAPFARDLFWRMKYRDQKAMRSGSWKYLATDDGEFLFDLARDARERANLARREIKVMFEELLHRLPDIEISGEPDMLQSAFIHGIKRMPCAFTPAR